MVDREDFDPSIALPPGLEIAQIRRSVEYVEREASDLVDIYYEQKNVFSAIVSGGGRTHTFGVKNPAKRFRDCSVYRRHGIRIRDGKPVPENGA